MAAVVKTWVSLRDAASGVRLRRRSRAAALGLEWRLCVATGVVLALLIAAMLAVVLWMCDGRLIYVLDDPYISLSLGWHIAHGHYGINFGEAASPSSSILYPLILACFAWTAWQDWVPLVVNTAAAIGTGLTFAVAACRHGVIARPDQVVRGTALIVFLCVMINTVTLVFTGLEHSLHTLTSVLVVLGLAQVVRGERTPAWLPVAIVLAPLWRFEGLALAVLAIAGLAALRRWRAAAAALAGIALTIGPYMAAMHALGLPLLPSSVLIKSAVAQHAVDGSMSFVDFVQFMLQDAAHRLCLEALPVCLLTVFILAHPLRRAVRRSADDRSDWSLFREVVFATVVAGALLVHILFGRWGWFARYEDYAVATGAVGALILWRGPLARFVERPRPLAIVTTAFLSFYYIVAAIQAPAAAREIYEQHYQMHRFAVDFYRGPVAVNDLGWVSYRNPNYVLDLWGLGSEVERQARARGEVNPAWLERLVEAHRIGVVMIYESWFPGQLPPSWRRLAELHTSHHVVAGFNTVAFFATSPEAAATARRALDAFGRELIAGSHLVVFDEPSAPTGPEQSAN